MVRQPKSLSWSNFDSSGLKQKSLELNTKLVNLSVNLSNTVLCFSPVKLGFIC